MVRFEIAKIFRNKLILFFVFCLPVVSLLIFSCLATPKVYIAVYTHGKELREIEQFEYISNRGINNIILVDDVDAGMTKVKNKDVCIFLDIDSESDPISIVCYYDNTDMVANSVASQLSNVQNEYAYDTITGFLESYSIKLKKEYFEVFKFQTLNDMKADVPGAEEEADTEGERSVITINTSESFNLQMITMISIVLMFGLAYSMARDNEFSTSKSIGYMPIGINRYMMSKVAFYIAIGVLQVLLTLLVGVWRFHVTFDYKIFVLPILSLPFILAVLSLGLILGQTKNQTVTIFASIATILVPIWVFSMVSYTYLGGFFKVLMSIFPITPYNLLLAQFLSYGTINFGMLELSLAQLIAFYLIAYGIQRYRLHR